MLRNETLSERIFETLKNDILAGYYAPGDRLLYEKVAERLGVSMTPLKDALRRLEQEGLVSSISRRGTFVTELTKKDIIEYCQIRLALESLAVDLLCMNGEISEDDIEALVEINDEIRKAIKKKDPKECIIHDIQFHIQIVSMSGNERLIEMLKQFPLSNFLVFMGRGDKSIENGKMILDDHNKIISALKQKDCSSIKKILSQNIFLPYDQIFDEHNAPGANKAEASS